MRAFGQQVIDLALDVLLMVLRIAMIVCFSLLLRMCFPALSAEMALIAVIGSIVARQMDRH